MKVKVFTHNSLVTGIIAIIFGALLAYFQADFINLFLMAAGILLLAVAAIDFIKFLQDNKGLENKWSFLPFSVVFLAIAGILLLVFPAVWVTLSEIVIAVLVMILALSKIMLLFELKKNGVKVGIWYAVLPSLLLIICIAAIMNPAYVLGSLSMIFGIMIIAFGIAEIFDYIIIRNDSLKKRFGSLSFENKDDIQEAEEVKE